MFLACQMAKLRLNKGFWLARDMKNASSIGDCQFKSEGRTSFQSKILFLQLSWIISSAEKLSILSVGRYTYTSDLRFQPVMREDPSDDSETWTLRVRRVREEDEAKYECQINTKPEKSRHVYLRVVGELVHLVDLQDVGYGNQMENN